jgi:NLI interacting factor-like phosphatase
MASPMPGLPYVFVIDLDGTIVGRVDYQSQRYTLQMILKQAGVQHVKREKNNIPSAYSSHSRLVRPGLTNFMRTIYDFYGGRVYFFVYTASERIWAQQQIKWIEHTHGIRFARPIFTRDDCNVDSGGNMRKSINRIWPRISKVVAHNMSPQERTHILQNQLIIIDNNAVYTDHTDKLLLCPDYDYLHFENILDIVPAHARNHPNVERFILSLANQGLVCPFVDADDHVHKLAKEYGWLSNKCKTIAETNNKYLHDKFWSILRKLIVANRINRFSPNIVVQLQTNTWKTMRRS